MLKQLRQAVYNSNRAIKEHGLAIFTWGNVSGIEREECRIVIKPSGVEYEELSPDNMVVLDLDGKVVEGAWKPSSDTPTHLELYRAFPQIGGIVHTHSKWATVWAQAGVGIPGLGTTHADYFYGEIPCTRMLTEAEVKDNYELNTAKVIIETIGDNDPLEEVPAVLVRNHGPFVFGKDTEEAVYHAVVLEYVAEMAYHTLALNKVPAIEQHLLDKHFKRKHGPGAYYGQ